MEIKLNDYHKKELFIPLQAGYKYETDMKTMASDNFKRYSSPEQYAEAFQQMIDARERWRFITDQQVH